MGNLLRVLHCKDEAYDDCFLDFEDARPSESEKDVHTEVSIVLSHAPGIIKDLEGYKGAGVPIREAIQNPSTKSLEKAWDAIIPLVKQLKFFFDFSIKLEKCLHALLGALTTSDQTPVQHLESKQALAKQFAEILQYTLKFDDLKMNNSNIQNDFSYFRRIMSTRGMTCASSAVDGADQVFSTEFTNRMSLFYAESTPMLKTLSDGTMRFVVEKEKGEFERTSEVLSTMCNICKVMLENPEHIKRFHMGEDTAHFCLRVMVGVIILYDHVHPMGAFCKGSKIDIKGAIKVLKDQHSSQMVVNLLNALRYTTKHLKDDTTPKAIRKDLEPEPVGKPS